MAQFCYLRLYLAIESVSCRLVQRIVGMEMNLNLRKLGQLFQVSMLCLFMTLQGDFV